MTAPPTSPYATPTEARLERLGPSVVRPAAVVSFISGLLFCVPVITQAIGSCAALFALVRRRVPHERVALAWVGLALSTLALSVWLLFIMAVRNMPAKVPFLAVTTGRAQAIAEGWQETAPLADQMERIHRAAAAYWRDDKTWPDSVELLVGRSLPLGFTMSPRLRYRPVPSSETFSAEWVLIVSDPVRIGLNGEPLDGPHRLILRVSGKIELLPEADADALLAGDP